MKKNRIVPKWQEKKRRRKRRKKEKNNNNKKMHKQSKQIGKREKEKNLEINRKPKIKWQGLSLNTSMFIIS